MMPELEGVEPDLQGWSVKHGLFPLAIAAVRPRTIIEVGT